jgi:hypothetical protein
VKTLDEVAVLWRLDEQMDLPVLWIKRRIKSGKFRARKLGRQWLMTDEDITYNLDRLVNVTVTDAPAAGAAGAAVPSAASMRRRRLA